MDVQRPSKEPRSIRAPKSQHANYADLRHGAEFVDNLRRGHAGNRQSAAAVAADSRSPKTNLSRTGSLQQPASEARRWNVNAGAPNERLAYQPHSPAHVYGHDNVAAKQSGNELKQTLHSSAQPARSASMRQTEMRYPAAAADGGDMISDISIRATGPPPSVAVNNSPLTSTMDVIQPGMPAILSANQQITANQYTTQRDSFDLPAPPTPPCSSMVPSSLSGDRLPSPPMMITPPPDTSGHFPPLPLPQYLPPPELVVSSASGDIKVFDLPAAWHGSDGTSATSTVADNMSDSSSQVTAQPTDDLMKADPPLVRDTRSDLLAAIREGV